MLYAHQVDTYQPISVSVTEPELIAMDILLVSLITHLDFPAVSLACYLADVVAAGCLRRFNSLKDQVLFDAS